MNFKEGDIFYTESNGAYHTVKVLSVEVAAQTLHVQAFRETKEKPTPENIAGLELDAYHLPIDINGFDNPVLITNRRVTNDDLIGYYEYIRYHYNLDDNTIEAMHYFRDGFQFTDDQKHKEAIEAYTKAIQLVPNYYEAIDNRAFCYMDLGEWEKAIIDFERSLEIQPKGFIATFSIGECHFKSGEYEKSKLWFEKADSIQPNSPFIKTYLDKIAHQLDKK